MGRNHRLLSSSLGLQSSASESSPPNACRETNAHAGAVKKTYQQEESTMYWCAIAHKSMRKEANWNDMFWGWRGTIQHSAEGVLPCWSWLQQQWQASSSSSLTAEHNNCVILIIDGLQCPPHPWTIKLIEEGMGCRLQYLNNLHDLEALQANMTDTNGNYERHEFVQFDFQDKYWLDTQDIPTLRRRVRLHGTRRSTAKAHARFLPTKPLIETTGPKSVGIVKRVHKRLIQNVDNITAALNDAGFPTVHVQEMNDLTLVEQASWFASHDIILAVHGGAIGEYDLYPTKYDRHYSLYAQLLRSRRL